MNVRCPRCKYTCGKLDYHVRIKTKVRNRKDMFIIIERIGCKICGSSDYEWV